MQMTSALLRDLHRSGDRRHCRERSSLRDEGMRKLFGSACVAAGEPRVDHGECRGGGTDCHKGKGEIAGDAVEPQCFLDEARNRTLNAFRNAVRVRCTRGSCWPRSARPASYRRPTHLPDKPPPKSGTCGIDRARIRRSKGNDMIKALQAGRAAASLTFIPALPSVAMGLHHPVLQRGDRSRVAEPCHEPPH
jgi:hypothetical protein